VEARTTGGAVTYSANIEPAKSVNVAFKVGGYIAKIRQAEGADGRKRDIQAGDPVTQGEILAEVDPEQYSDQVKEARAQLAAAEAAQKKADADFKRATALFKSASMTAPEYDTYRKEYESARASVAGAGAQLDDAEDNLGYTRLKTPLTGVVLQRNVEVGTLVSPQTVGFVVADASSVKAVFGVPDVALTDVKAGDPIPVTNASLPGRRFDGTVTEIAPAADSATRVFDVEVTLPNADGLLRVGMVVSLALQAAPPAGPTIQVPLTAVVRGTSGADAYAVYLVETKGQADVVRLTEVELGEVTGSEIAVTGGLTAGDRVVVTGATLVRDGQTARIIP
jgi:RND family efflux transporter MFP subunit